MANHTMHGAQGIEKETKKREREEILSDPCAILLRENVFPEVWWKNFVLIMVFCFTITNSFEGKIH